MVLCTFIEKYRRFWRAIASTFGAFPRHGLCRGSGITAEFVDLNRDFNGPQFAFYRRPGERLRLSFDTQAIKAIMAKDLIIGQVGCQRLDEA